MKLLKILLYLLIVTSNIDAIQTSTTRNAANLLHEKHEQAGTTIFTSEAFDIGKDRIKLRLLTILKHIALESMLFACLKLNDRVQQNAYQLPLAILVTVHYYMSGSLLGIVPSILWNTADVVFVKLVYLSLISRLSTVSSDHYASPAIGITALGLLFSSEIIDLVYYLAKRFKPDWLNQWTSKQIPRLEWPAYSYKQQEEDYFYNIFLQQIILSQNEKVNTA